MADTILWGAGGQAVVLHELLEGNGDTIVALFDNDPQATSPFDGVPLHCGVTGFDRWLAGRGGGDLQGIAAIGLSGADRLDVHELFSSRGVRVATAVHRSAFLASDAVVETGAQVMAQASICSRAILRDGALVNTAACVDHQCIVERGASVGPGAVLTGRVVVEEFAFIGAGAIVLPRLRIGAGSIVGAGAVVTKDVSPGEIVVGNPARARLASSVERQ
jgi:sugar O-acyltransferase (sialic acid O-acetyltransferase NeuD family)